MKAFKRLFYIVQFLFFICYVCLPPLWLLGFPYWVLSGKDLWDDWWNFNRYYKL